jgi:hypothetical protein
MKALLAVVLLAALGGCTSPEQDGGTPDVAIGDGTVSDTRPTRFTIVPDDYHVPYAGTAEDGRRFFLSQLFTAETDFVGLFLWKPDGTFDEVKVTRLSAPDEVDAAVESRLAELGDYALEAIEVEPFIETVDGVKFGWRVKRYEDQESPDGYYVINIEPGDFIAYYAPWDGLEYDT